MSENLSKAQDIILEKINQICREFGLNNIMAQLYAVLYFVNKPLSLDDMVEKLKISKGSVSVNIRALERYGIARRIWVKGSRRDYYEAEQDITKVIMDRIKSMARRRISEFGNMLDTAYNALRSVDSIKAEEKEDIKIFKDKLDVFRNIQDRVESVFNLLDSDLVTNMLTKQTKKDSKTDKNEILV